MSYNITIVLLGWVLIIAIFLGFIVLLRYLKHRERMALITHGINPNRLDKPYRNRGLLRAGLITMMVGLSLRLAYTPSVFCCHQRFRQLLFTLVPGFYQV